MTTSSTIDGGTEMSGDENAPASAAPASASQTPAAETPAAETPAAETPATEAPAAEPAPEAPGAASAAPEGLATEVLASEGGIPVGGPDDGQAGAGRDDADASTAASEPTEQSAEQSADAPGNHSPAGPASPGRTAGRRRIPRPGRPHARGPRPTLEPVEVPPSDPSQWGRVDEDGAVWLRTADGERQVGSYPGVPADEALALFGRKYDELTGQVRLLQQRVEAADLPPKDAAATLEKLRSAVTEAAVIGDLAALTTVLDDVEAAVERRRVESEQARAQAREAARVTKERIVGDAEKLAETTTWKASGDRLRALLEEWKAAPRLDRKADDEMWKRFSAARSAFDKKRRAHFAALDSSREEAKEVKTRIVKEAEKLATSQEWGPTAGRYRQLLEEWKASGRAAKPEEDALWERFRAAQDQFFTARNATFEERDASARANLEIKEKLAAEAERLLPVKDLRAAKTALRGLQEKWEAAGHVPRADKERVEGRMRKVEQAVREAEQDQWQRSNPEARARAESATGQLRASIEKLEAQAAAARQAGNEKKAAEADAAAAAKREWLAQAEKYMH